MQDIINDKMLLLQSIAARMGLANGLEQICTETMKLKHAKRKHSDVSSRDPDGDAYCTYRKILTGFLQLVMTRSAVAGDPRITEACNEILARLNEVAGDKRTKFEE